METTHHGRENWEQTRWQNFRYEELADKLTGNCAMSALFMDSLQSLRTQFAKPMIVSSGFRSPHHPLERRKAKPGAHAQGLAADIAISGKDSYLLLKLAIEAGFHGIGIKQHGEWSKRFIHLDKMERETPQIWTYQE